MQRRGRMLPILAAMSAVLLVGAQGSAADGDVTTITFSGDGSETFMAAQLKVIDLFEAAHPNIKVKFEPAPGVDAEQGAILRLGQGDTSLDVVTTEVGYEYQWFKNGWLESLTPYFTQEELDQVDAHLLDNVTFDGAMLSTPMDNSTMYLAVNQDLLAEAGVTPPPTLKRNTLQETVDGVWTWEQVLEAGKQVQAATGKTGLLFPNDETWILAPMGQQLGGKMSSPDGLEVKGYLDQAPWVDLATRWQRFFENGTSAITTPEWTNDQFLAGEAAFALTHIGGFGICEQAAFDCDAAAQPYFEGGKKTVQSTGIAWALNAASQHKAEAAEFLKFALLDPGAQKALVDGLYFAAIPMTKAGLAEIEADPAYQEFPKQVRLLGAYQFQNWPQEMYRMPANATFFTALSDAFENVRVGAQTPEQAVNDMTDKVDRDLALYR
jgi:ABC-type glycerol-3-phosphate transport system substrate-binding protein